MDCAIVPPAHTIPLPPAPCVPVQQPQHTHQLCRNLLVQAIQLLDSTKQLVVRHPVVALLLRHTQTETALG